MELQELLPVASILLALALVTSRVMGGDDDADGEGGAEGDAGGDGGGE